MYGQILKINVDTLKEYSKQEAEYRIIDNSNILQSILSKQFPVKRIGGFVNFIAATRPSATANEIQKALVIRESKNIFFHSEVSYIYCLCLWSIAFTGLFVWLSE